MSTPSMLDDVAAFHAVVLQQPPAHSPTLISREWLTERFRFLTEEIEEFYSAALVGDITGATDGLLDTIYVALGTLYLMGIPVEKCWAAVQTANMAKVPGVTSRGNAIDAVKPDNWIPPEGAIAQAILEAIDATAA